MLENLIAEILKKNKKTVAIAESCTGGLLCHIFTNIPGSSKFFKLGIIPYLLETKESILKIPKDILKKGTVSEEVACRMAKNIKNLAKSDFGIGITGFAGPEGGTRETPVGTVFISIVENNKSITKRFLFKGDRLSIKKQAVESCLKLFKRCL